MPRLQFIGINLDTIKLDIHLNAAFRVNPLAAAKELETYSKNGEVLTFILGGKKIGKGKYVITNLSESHKSYSAIGTVTKINLAVSLKEYN